MQTEHAATDITVLQTQFELKSTEFDRALKKDAELAEIKQIFHEMRILHRRIAELRQSVGIHTVKSKGNKS